MTDISKITLYSGGHKGTEAEFGKLAEEWNMAEVNISFEGHETARTRGVKVLTREELQTPFAVSVRASLTILFVLVHRRRYGCCAAFWNHGACCGRAEKCNCIL